MSPMCANERPGWREASCELRAGHSAPYCRAYTWNPIHGAKKHEWRHDDESV